ncbi:MAG: DoxX family protein [Labilithrix sp.]|nr:DoxX family protein [Labilithrix sp.]
MATLSSTETRNGAARPTTALLWTGRVLNALPLLMLTMSAVFKLTHAPDFVAMWTGKLGWSEGSLTGIGLLELAVVAVHLVPRAALVGAVLITAYLGGAVAAHVRIGDAFAIPVVLGVLLWTGFALRDERVRALLLPRKP